MKIKANPIRVDYTTQTRRDIEKLNGILKKFATDEGFDEYCEKNTVALTVGDDTVDLYFSPRTWDAAEWFIKFCVCHLIEADELDKFPYYDKMADRYAADIGEPRGSFD